VDAIPPAVHSRPLTFLLSFAKHVLAAGCFVQATAWAQTARDTVVEITTTTAAASPYITLTWNSAASVTAQKVWRRVKGGTNWGTATNLGAGDLSYADPTALPGVAYEYSFQRTRSVAPTTVYGAIVAGYQVPLLDQRGKVILLVDNTMSTPLAPDLTLLQRNLAGDGWTVYRHDVERSVVAASDNTAGNYAKRLSEVQTIRALVQSDYNSAPGTDWALLIVGRVPMPYSGYIAPDGHPDHSGAWSTDAYYADVNGTWTDTSVDNTSVSLSDARNRNVPGDGKFDQSSLPSDVEIQTGRVDLLNLASVPAGLDETTLLRQYLARNHQFRRGLGPYASVQRRAIVDDNFGYFGGEAFASSGYRNAIGFFGRNAGQVDATDWFGTLGTLPVLFAHGCGGGSFTSASGVGTSTYDFSRRDSKAVFTQLFGSYFGDWDSSNNFLRSPLAGTQDSLGLACMWSGRGYFHLYHMALGEALGYGVRYSQNNNENTFSGGWSQNGFNRSIHMGLVGDPTLRLHTVIPPTRVVASSGAGGVTLTWQASADGTLGYHVYVGTSVNGPFTRLTGGATSTADPAGSPLAALTYLHTAAVAGTAYIYLVKAVKLETSASGTYVNTSVGEMAQVTHQSGTPLPLPPTNLVVAGTGSTNFVLTWEDNATDETAYEVQWRNPASNTWSLAATLGPNITTSTHNGATAGLINYYRVRAANGTRRSAFTAETAQYNLPGLVDVRNDFVQGNLSSGTFVVPLRRFSGSQGAVTATYTTTAVLGTPGTDLTAPSGTATWGHGVSGDFNVNVGVPSGGPRLTSIFRVDVTSPGGGLALSNGLRCWGQIGDPASQVLPAAWQSAAIGATGAGYSESVSGVFGATVRSGDITGTADSFRLTYRTITGDCRMTARIFYFSPMVGTTRAGLMIRESTAAGSRMNSILAQPTGGVTRVYRPTLNGTADNTATQAGLPVAIWLRATRSGNNLSTQYSSDGSTWTDLGTAITLAAAPADLLMGLALLSNNVAVPEVWGYARFDNLEMLHQPLPPATLAAAYGPQAGEIALAWEASLDCTQYRLERSAQAGTGFAEIGVVSGTTFTDSGLTPGQLYFYRVRGTNSLYTSAYSGETSAAPLNVIESWRLNSFGTTSNSGLAADNADFDHDGLPNLVEFALGQPANQPATSPKVLVGKTTVGAQSFLTLTYARKLSATGVTLWVDAAALPNGAWSQIDPLDSANQVSVQDNVPAAGWQTFTIKDTVPMQGSPGRTLRLRATRP
jgi:hypothetical protein